MKTAGFRTAISSVLIVALLTQTCYAGIAGTLGAVAAWMQANRRYPGPYTTRPIQPYLGTNPSRDPVLRGGFWRQRTLRDAERIYPAEPANLGDSISIGLGFIGIGIDAPLTLQGSGGGGGGGAMGGEGYQGGGPQVGGSKGQGSAGAGGSSGSIVNTNTGNRLSYYNLVSWPMRGGMDVDYTLYFNSISTYSKESGYGWSHSYDINLDYTPSSSAVVRWPDGSLHPYAEVSAGVFTEPAGVNDKLVKNTDNSWTLTTHSQIKYHFTVLNSSNQSFCDSITDRNGNVITINLNSNNYPSTVVDATGRTLTFAYDSNNRISSITDPTSRVWTMTYSGSGNLTSIGYPAINGNNYSRTFSFDQAHNMTQETDLRGKIWRFGYDIYSRQTSWKDPLLNETTFTYNASNTVITNPAGKTITHNYQYGLLTSEVDEAAFAENYTWDGDRNLTQLQDRNGKVWNFTFDTEGNMLTAVNPSPFSKTWTFTYDTGNNLKTAKDPYNNTWTLNYTTAGNLETVYDPLNRRNIFVHYNTYGQPDSIKNALNNEVILEYGDTHKNLTKVKDPYLKETTATYDTLGRILSVTDPLSHTSSVEYDNWGRPWKFIHPNSDFATVVYDPESLVTSATDENSNSSSFSYDDAMRLITATNAKSEVTTYAYDNLSQVTGITNARNYTRTYEYTDRGEVKKLTMPDGAIEQWSYDGNGNTTAYTNPLTQVISYVYDEASRLWKVDYPTGTDTVLTYDDADRMTQMVDASGTTTWTYNTAYELTQLATPQGQIDYTYDDAGRPYTMVQQGVGTTTYSFDDASRLISLVNPFSETTSFAYDDASRLTRKTFSSGAYEDYGYDNRDRVTSIDLKNSSNTVLASHEYTFDAVSNVLTRTDDGVCTTFTYDVIDQLLSESRTGYSASYTYDANGNRLTKTLNDVVQTYVNDAGDKLTGIWQGLSQVKAFTYDAAGRTTAITEGAVTTNFSYDYEDRIIQITRSGMTTNSFGYNGFGTRVSKTDSGGTASVMRNGIGVTAPVIGDGSANFTPGISERRSSTTKHYSCDLKSTVAQLDTSQAISASKQYDAFGNVTSSTGTFNGPFAYGGKFGYQSDGDTNLQLLGHRYYDPSLGRFLTRDSSRAGRNWYSYCDNNPVSYFDAEGLKKRLIIIIGGCAGGDDGWTGDAAVWQYRHKFINDIIDVFGDEYEIFVVEDASKKNVLDILRDERVDAVVFYGHGSYGEIWLDDGRLTAKDLVGIHRKKLFDFILVACCYVCKDSSMIAALLGLATVVWGYPDVTFDLSKGARRPVPFYSPPRKDPKVDGGGIPPSGGKKGKKGGKAAG